MRWWLALLLLLVPAAHAATDGWYYAGDTFTIGNVVYTVESAGDYDKVLLDVGGRTYVLQLAECVTLPLAKYCYSETGFPDDDTHVKYEGGEEYFGYRLSIAALEPAIEISREITPTDPELHEKIDVIVTIQNKGEIGVEQFTYKEAIPDGLTITGGPKGDAKTISYLLKSLPQGKVEKFRYSLEAIDFVSASLDPAVTYSYSGQLFNGTIAKQTLTIDAPIEVTRTVTSPLDLGQTGTYELELENTDSEERMEVSVTVEMPKNLTVRSAGDFAAKGTSYSAKFDLDKARSKTLSLTFVGNIGGTYQVPLTLEVIRGDASFTRHFNDTVVAKADKLAPTIRLSSNKASFAPGEQVVISALLENKNTVATFQSIGGSLESQGLFKTIPFSHQAFPPSKTLTELEYTVVVPNVTESTTYTITFSGQYATAGGETFEYTASRDLVVAPRKEMVVIERTLTPQAVTPGMNLTVEVLARNVYNEYVTFTTHESYDPLLQRVGGLTYSENSLERDASKQLYVYQLEIPQNYSGSSFNLTTEVLVKGEQSQKFITPVTIFGSQDAQANTTAPAPVAAQDVVAAPVVEEKKPGIFSRLWTTLKGWMGKA